MIHNTLRFWWMSTGRNLTEKEKKILKEYWVLCLYLCFLVKILRNNKDLFS